MRKRCACGFRQNFRIYGHFRLTNESYRYTAIRRTSRSNLFRIRAVRCDLYVFKRCSRISITKNMRTLCRHFTSTDLNVFHKSVAALNGANFPCKDTAPGAAHRRNCNFHVINRTASIIACQNVCSSRIDNQLQVLHSCIRRITEQTVIARIEVADCIVSTIQRTAETNTCIPSRNRAAERCVAAVDIAAQYVISVDCVCVRTRSRFITRIFYNGQFIKRVDNHRYRKHVIIDNRIIRRHNGRRRYSASRYAYAVEIRQYVTVIRRCRNRRTVHGHCNFFACRQAAMREFGLFNRQRRAVYRTSDFRKYFVGNRYFLRQFNFFKGDPRGPLCNCSRAAVGVTDYRNRRRSNRDVFIAIVVRVVTQRNGNGQFACIQSHVYPFVLVIALSCNQQPCIGSDFCVNSCIRNAHVLYGGVIRHGCEQRAVLSKRHTVKLHVLHRRATQSTEDTVAVDRKVTDCIISTVKYASKASILTPSIARTANRRACCVNIIAKHVIARNTSVFVLSARYRVFHRRQIRNRSNNLIRIMQQNDLRRIVCSCYDCLIRTRSSKADATVVIRLDAIYYHRCNLFAVIEHRAAFKRLANAHRNVFFHL